MMSRISVDRASVDRARMVRYRIKLAVKVFRGGAFETLYSTVVGEGLRTVKWVRMST